MGLDFEGLKSFHIGGCLFPTNKAYIILCAYTHN
jgi:hypothetical protein